MQGIILSKLETHPFEKVLGPSMLTNPIYPEHNSLQGLGLVVVISGFYLGLTNSMLRRTHLLTLAKYRWHFKVGVTSRHHTLFVFSLVMENPFDSNE
jgi:hypothetical protein